MLIAADVNLQRATPSPDCHWAPVRVALFPKLVPRQPSKALEALSLPCFGQVPSPASFFPTGRAITPPLSTLYECSGLSTPGKQTFPGCGSFIQPLPFFKGEGGWRWEVHMAGELSSFILHRETHNRPIEVC